MKSILILAVLLSSSAFSKAFVKFEGIDKVAEVTTVTMRTSHSFNSSVTLILDTDQGAQVKLEASDYLVAKKLRKDLLSQVVTFEIEANKPSVTNGVMSAGTKSVKAEFLD